VPVTDHGRLVGIVSRRDLLRVLVRSDADVRRDVLRLVEVYTGDLDAWHVAVLGGVTTIRRVRGTPHVAPATEERALTALARTVGGVVGVRVLRPAHQAARPPDRRVPAADPGSGS
jgi:CBS domain-containing protein